MNSRLCLSAGCAWLLAAASSCASLPPGFLDFERLRDERASGSDPDDGDSIGQLGVRSDIDARDRDFPISPLKPNYFLLATYNNNFDTAPFEAVDPENVNLRSEEVKYQISAKLPVWRNVTGPDSDLYFGYTQTAWWQLYTSTGRLSAPFRETNYEPEIFLRHFGGGKLPLGGEITGYDIALVHESNGRSEPLSRSWNRLLARTVLDYGDLAFLARLWWRLPESDEEDDNPNEYRYLGYGDVRAIWAPNENTITAMVRPGTEGSGFELTWSREVSDVLRVYVQWFNGYGESLIDYDNYTNRIGIGLAMSDYVSRRR